MRGLAAALLARCVSSCGTRAAGIRLFGGCNVTGRGLGFAGEPSEPFAALPGVVVRILCFDGFFVSRRTLGNFCCGTMYGAPFHW